jgi:hypothetical protein
VIQVAMMRCYGAKFTNTNHSGYTPTPLDLAHISFDDDDDLQLLQEGASPMTQDVGDVVDREAGAATSSLPLLHLPRTLPDVIGFAGVRTSDVSRGLSARRLMMLYSEDKAVIVIGALLALVASPVEVVQFIYVSLALDDAATDGSKASFSGSIGMLCILYAIAAAAVTLNLMLLQSVGHRVAARVRRSLVASVLRQEVSFLFGHNDDILQQTLTADVESIRKAVSSQLARWIQACVQVQLLHRPLSPSQPHNLSVCSGFRWRRAAFRFVVAPGPRPPLRPSHHRHCHGAASKFTANPYHPNHCLILPEGHGVLRLHPLLCISARGCCRFCRHASRQLRAHTSQWQARKGNVALLGPRVAG